MLGGRLSDRHSGEVVQWLFGLGWSFAILSITILANISDILVILANFVNGLCQGNDSSVDHWSLWYMYVESDCDIIK